MKFFFRVTIRSHPLFSKRWNGSQLIILSVNNSKSNHTNTRIRLGAYLITMQIQKSINHLTKLYARFTDFDFFFEF